MKDLLHPYTAMMRRYHRQKLGSGRAVHGSTPEDFFGFTLDDIECVHHQMVGEGFSTWFRLHDGRVISSEGIEYNPEPSLYDVALN
jgi:hypothetical protein